MRKPTLHIVQDYDDLAFDVRPYNAIGYSTRYSEAHKLTDAILGVIERDSANRYRFSNPVNESLDSGSHIYVNGNTSPTSNDESISVIEEIRSTSSTVNIIFEMVAELTRRYMDASEASQTHRGSVRRLNEGEQLSRKLLLTRVFAKTVSDFANEIGVSLPMFKDSWIALNQDLTQVFDSNSIRSAGESREVSTFIETVQLLMDKVIELAGRLDRLCDSFIDDVGQSADVDRDLELATLTLRKVTDELRVGSAVLSNIVDRSRTALDQAAY